VTKPSEDWSLRFPAQSRAFKFSEIDSTNTFLKSLADQGGEHFSIAVAKAQDAGRGRGDRTWISNEGNVFWSILIRPGANWPSLSSLPLVLALAVHKTVAEFTNDESRLAIKWPNDLLLDGKKLSGMLLETTTQGAKTDGHMIDWCVAGIGINVNSHPIGNTNYDATDLFASGFDGVSRDHVIERLSENAVNMVDQWAQNGFEIFHADVEHRLAFLGERIDVASGTDRSKRITGRLAGLTSDGFARLDTPTGVQVLSAGEVFGF